jgi:hypothetical protein
MNFCYVRQLATVCVVFYVYLFIYLVFEFLSCCIVNDVFNIILV